MIWQFLVTYRWSHLLPYLIVGALVIVYWRKYRKRWPQIRNLVSTAGVVMLMHLVLLDNPIAFLLYDEMLDPSEEEIGWFQDAMLYVRGRNYSDAPEEVKLLAMGSSQTLALYNSNDDLGFQVLTYQGMQPGEFPFAMPFVERYDPQTIMVYVSAFDLGRPIYIDKIKTLNPSLHRAGEIIDLYRYVEPDKPLASAECFASWLIPEYRYSFAFKALRDKAFGRKKAFSQFDPPPTPSQDESPKTAETQLAETREAAETQPAKPEHGAYFLGRIDSLRGMTNRHFDKHLEGLRRFCDAYADRKIIIIEGHYHPLAYDMSPELHKQAAQRLSAIAEQFDHVRFIPIGQLYQLTADDYRDAYHVSNEGGERFQKHLFENVLKIAPTTATAPARATQGGSQP